MKLKNIALILLVIIGIVMIVMGIKANMKPPILTGVGFIIIGYLCNQTTK